MNLREAAVLRLGLDFAAYVRACIIGLMCLTTTAYAENRSETIFFLNDALGSAVAAVNEDGELCWSEDYTPYGDKTINDDLVSPVGCGIVGEERGYTGHTEDVNSDLVYMQQRYYDPSIGRFLSIDLLDAIPAEPKSYNRYAYAFNNPYKYVDPNGLYGSDWTADNFEQYNNTDESREIENGLRDGSGNLAPGYSQSDMDDHRSRASMSMDVYPALAANGDIKGLLGIAVPFGNLKGLLGAKRVPSIRQQALDLKKLNNNKNTVTVQSPGKKTHFDLDGATHKGVKTPHKQFSNQNTNSKTGETFFNKDRTTVEPLTQQDLWTVRNILDRRNQ